MSNRFQKLLKPLIIGAVVVFGISCLLKKPQNFEDYWSNISSSVFVIGIVFILYERFLWRFIPWNRPPVLCKQYNGEIKYIENGSSKKKDISILIEQTLFSIRVKGETDINSSYSVAGNIIEEHGEHVLYYTYVTNPSVMSQNNPIQHGTCRIVLTDKCNNLRGKYWTSSETIGDIHWRASH